MSIRKLLYDNHWTIGFVQNDLGSILHGDNLEINWVNNPYKDRWFADPFILDVNEEYIILLVEEFFDPIARGRISRLVINRQSYDIVDIKPVLELSTHLSFPAIIRVDNRIYIYPENSQAGELNLYEYDIVNENCSYIKTLCKEPLTDAVLTNLFGDTMIFSTHIPSQNGNCLSCYRKRGDVYAKVEDYAFSSNIARNAGDWFDFKGTVYRPAQDCNQRYGGGMYIQEVININSTEFSFKNIVRIEESCKGYELGCHTFNYYNGVTVIDVNGYRRPFLAKLGKRFADFRRSL